LAKKYLTGQRRRRPSRRPEPPPVASNFAPAFDVLERLDLSTTPLSDRGRTALQTLVKLCFPDRVAVSGDEVILTVNASLGLIARAASWSRVTEKDVNVIAAMAAAMLAAQGVAVDDELRTRQRRREADEALT
jgi:hypothetical protein